jgi:hypothetical protein
MRKWAKAKRGGILREGGMRDGGFRVRDRAPCAKEDHAARILKTVYFIWLNLIVRLN